MFIIAVKHYLLHYKTLKSNSFVHLICLRATSVSMLIACALFRAILMHVARWVCDKVAPPGFRTRHNSSPATTIETRPVLKFSSSAQGSVSRVLLQTTNIGRHRCILQPSSIGVSTTQALNWMGEGRKVFTKSCNTKCCSCKVWLANLADGQVQIQVCLCPWPCKAIGCYQGSGLQAGS